MNLLRRYQIAAALFVCVFAAAGGLKWRQYRYFAISDYDTGVYSNVAWNIAHGQGFYSAINKRNQLGEHFSPIMAAFAPLYRVWESPLNILLAQAAAVSLAIVLFYLIARMLAESLPEQDRRWFVFTCTAMAAFYLPVHSALSFEFHPSTLGMPMVAGAILCLHRRRFILFWLLIAALIATKEVALLSVAGIGIYAGLVLRRRLLMSVLIAGAALAAVAIFAYLMPAFRENTEWKHYGRVSFFANPLPKLEYIVLLAAYLGFLPLLSGRAFWAVLPTTLLNVCVKMKEQYGLAHHYDDQNCVFWLIAAMHGLLFVYIAARKIQPVSQRWRQAQAGLAVALIAVSFYGGGLRFIHDWKHARPDPARESIFQRLPEFRALPADIGIIAQNGLGPYVCHRPRYVHLDDGFMKWKPYKPGDTILIAPKFGVYQLDAPKAIENLKSDPKVTLLDTTATLTVFRVK